jgi:hypothetical protein
VYSYLFSEKNLSPQNGGFIRAFWLVPDFWGKEFRAVAGSANCFFNCKVRKQILYRDLKWKKSFVKKKECLKTSPVGFFTKSNSSEQNIYRNRRLKINFQRCASQNKTRKIMTNSNSIGMYYKYFNNIIIFMI